MIIFCSKEEALRSPKYALLGFSAPTQLEQDIQNNQVAIIPESLLNKAKAIVAMEYLESTAKNKSWAQTYDAIQEITQPAEDDDTFYHSSQFTEFSFNHSHADYSFSENQVNMEALFLQSVQLIQASMQAVTA